MLHRVNWKSIFTNIWFLRQIMKRRGSWVWRYTITCHYRSCKFSICLLLTTYFRRNLLFNRIQLICKLSNFCFCVFAFYVETGKKRIFWAAYVCLTSIGPINMSCYLRTILFKANKTIWTRITRLWLLNVVLIHCWNFLFKIAVFFDQLLKIFV